MSDLPPRDPHESFGDDFEDGSEDGFDEIVAAETERDPDLATIEAGSRTLRTRG
ncbi:dihydrofolate synthase, partial [Streptomyces sp. NPDC001633]